MSALLHKLQKKKIILKIKYNFPKREFFQDLYRYIAQNSLVQFSTNCSVYVRVQLRGSVQYSTHCTAYSIKNLLYIVDCTVFSIQYSVQYNLFTVHCNLYNVQCTCTVKGVQQYSVYTTLHCRLLYTVQCKVLIIHCTLQIVQCTLQCTVKP